MPHFVCHGICCLCDVDSHGRLPEEYTVWHIPCSAAETKCVKHREQKHLNVPWLTRRQWHVKEGQGLLQAWSKRIEASGCKFSPLLLSRGFRDKVCRLKLYELEHAKRVDLCNRLLKHIFCEFVAAAPRRGQVADSEIVSANLHDVLVSFVVRIFLGGFYVGISDFWEHAWRYFG